MTSDVGKWPVSCRYCSIKNLELDHVGQSCRSSSWLSKNHAPERPTSLAGRWLSKSEDIGRISFLWVYIEYRQIPTYLSCCYLTISDHVSTNRLELLKHIFFREATMLQLGGRPSCHGSPKLLQVQTCWVAQYDLVRLYRPKVSF